MKLKRFATDRYRWWALVFLSLSLGIVIIDNTVLNVAIPYILRDLHTSFDAIQWVVSGYALIIATLLITVGRLGDIFGRKKIFILGIVFFAIGSFIASVSSTVWNLFLGEALIEAIGASMMLTSSLSLLVSEFQGRERALAFGVWGTVAGASATIGPMLGGWLTTYYSWRWSLRINVVVAIIAIAGSIFIKESRGDRSEHFDWIGVFTSGFGLFSLIFGFIEGRTYGWWAPTAHNFTIGEWQWPWPHISVIPFAFLVAIIFLLLFTINELVLEKRGGHPLLKMSLFKNKGFSAGLVTLGIVSVGQFGVFFIMPIYLQNVLGLNALQTGLVFLPTSLCVALFGPLSGFVASRIGPKWLTTVGMACVAIGTFLLIQSLTVTATWVNLAPGLALLGVGIGMASSQLTNIILSNVPIQFAGEASAANSTMRQVGTSVGTAIIGVILASSLNASMANYVTNDMEIPRYAKQPVLQGLQGISVESGQKLSVGNPRIARAVETDVMRAIDGGAKNALEFAIIFSAGGALLSLLIPNRKPRKWDSIAEIPKERKKLWKK
jgi:EmrB/QacA subfamily drug resistance transporter